MPETVARTNGRRAHVARRSPFDLAGKRAEIMTLISRLTASRLARAAHARGDKAEPRRSSPTEPAPASGAAAAMASFDARGADDGIVLALRALEVRLRRIEERLAEKRRSSWPLPPPRPDDEGATFSGLIQGQMLSDMLQLVSSNSMTGVFSVRNETGECVLHFDEGRMVHAEGPGLLGEEAFFAAFGFETGSYVFREGKAFSEERTIEAGTQFLILEALRRIDESRA